MIDEQIEDINPETPLITGSVDIVKNSDVGPSMPILKSEQIAQREDMLAHISGEVGVSDEERLEIRRRFSDLVSTVLSWSNTNEHEIVSVDRLGGGFKNPVLLITSASGKQFVAKGFSEQEGLTTTADAKEILDRITLEDEELIPKSEIFNDTLFSEKAKGVSVRSLVEKAVESLESQRLAESALFSVGSTLAFLHERTERPISKNDNLPEGVVDAALKDRKKIHKHIEQLDVAGLVGLSSEDMDAVLGAIDEFTEPIFISLVHGDSHLDNFFHEQGGAFVEIVDYDDICEGDPMTDLGRTLQSLRYWCEQFSIGDEVELCLTRSFVRGYESIRIESELIDGKGELDPQRVVVYGLRLVLVQLKLFSGLREKLGKIGENLGMSECEIMTAPELQSAMIEVNLTEDERIKFVTLRRLESNLRETLLYFRPVSEIESFEVDDKIQVAV